MEKLFETKDVLRKKYLDKRMTLSQDEVFLFSKEIFETFLNEFDLKPNSKIHCFLPITTKNEVGTKFFFDYCFENSIQIFVPKVVGEDLISIEITPETEFTFSKWNIKEPKTNIGSSIKEFDFCITPLLYADPLGNRLGYGKGFYDRFFSENFIKKKVGLNFFEPKEYISNVFETDILLDFLIIPNRIFVF
ncbi:5-formyltetrahydrofolate cyclo-ligase [Soonwooa sp.]|uniref:5-formyltetrahydrofolate cyclo-ligase n=1 Tax=Soonwooa sp. TaxID=1938592 RepID=UPI00260F5434|nr:5-formyltetrahydrofolate cyclo-ligase [Soonwooa sp.]